PRSRPGARPRLRPVPRFRDRRGSHRHERPDRGLHVVREQVRDPDEPRAARSVREHLHRGIVVAEATTHRGPAESPRFVVEGDDPFADDEAVGEGHHAGIAVQARIDEDARYETAVDLPDVANRAPDGVGGSAKDDFLAGGRHGATVRVLRFAVMAKVALPTPLPDALYRRLQFR